MKSNLKLPNYLLSVPLSELLSKKFVLTKQINRILRAKMHVMTYLIGGTRMSQKLVGQFVIRFSSPAGGLISNLFYCVEYNLSLFYFMKPCY